MKALSSLAAAALVLCAALAGCSQPSPEQVETVESLAADPERLKQLRQQCRTERQKLGDELCTRVALAVNKRFFGDGKAQYTPPEQPPKF